MTALHKALYSFWSSFGMPAYIAGEVPDDAQFPYVTFEVQEGAAFGQTYLTAIGWFYDSGTVNVQRAAFLDAVKEAIGPGGVKIDSGGAFCILYPNDANFLSYYDDPEDEHVLGARVSYLIRYYT